MVSAAGFLRSRPCRALLLLVSLAAAALLAGANRWHQPQAGGSFAAATASAPPRQQQQQQQQQQRGGRGLAGPDGGGPAEAGGGGGGGGGGGSQVVTHSAVGASIPWTGVPAAPAARATLPAADGPAPLAPLALELVELTGPPAADLRPPTAPHSPQPSWPTACSGSWLRPPPPRFTAGLRGKAGELHGRKSKRLKVETAESRTATQV